MTGEGAVVCPFCGTTFVAADSWCPHLLGPQADLTLDDYHDFISGEYAAKTMEDADGEPWYFMVRDNQEKD